MRVRSCLIFVVIVMFVLPAVLSAGETASQGRNLETILSGAERGPHKAGELLVRFKDGGRADRAVQIHGSMSSTVLKRLSSLGVEHVRLRPGLEVKEAIRQYMENPDVEYAEPNYIFSLTLPPVIPNDPDFGAQWGLDKISASSAWGATQGDREVVIAVIDSGIDPDHPDLQENLDPSLTRNFSDSDSTDDFFGHGTHVAGIIGAVGNNGVGVTGVMWRARMLNVKAISDDGFGDLAGIAAAIDYAVTVKKERGIDVSAMNMSLTAPIFSIILYESVRAAERAGILVVAAAGNDGEMMLKYPAAFNLPNVISVAATDENDLKANFSNFGQTWVNVAAPGTDIWSTGPTHPNSFGIIRYGSLSGTSMSTAFVTGLAGLLAAQYPYFTYKQIRSTILRYSDVVPSLRGRVLNGLRINAFKAVSSLLAPTALAGRREASGIVTLSWTDNATGENGYLVERRTGGGPFVQIAVLGPGRTSFTDVRASAIFDYTYRVRAFNTIPAKSLYSNEAEVKKR